MKYGKGRNYACRSSGIPSNSLTLLRSTISRGERPPGRLAHRFKSVNRTSCSTGISFTDTLIRIGSNGTFAQPELRIAASPVAAASNTLAAVTRTECDVPSESITLTLQLFSAMRASYHLRFLFAKRNFTRPPQKIRTRGPLLALLHRSVTHRRKVSKTHSRATLHSRSIRSRGF